MLSSSHVSGHASSTGKRTSSALRRPTPLTVLHLWHLLSLDAPTVATLWTAFIARASAIALPARSLVAMFVMVWSLYAADRLLDAQPLGNHPTATADLERRHLFHHRYRRRFLIVLGCATALLSALIPQLPSAALNLFLILGTLLAGYFVLIHATSGAHRLPKELAVGLFFAAAIFIPTVARLPHPAAGTLLPLAGLFAALCCANCLCIYAWEHPLDAAAEPHPLTSVASRHRRVIIAVVLLGSVLCAALVPHPSVALALALSSFALILLDHRYLVLAPLTLRAAADFALLSPALFLPFLHAR